MVGNFVILKGNLDHILEKCSIFYNSGFWMYTLPMVQKRGRCLGHCSIVLHVTMYFEHQLSKYFLLC